MLLQARADDFPCQKRQIAFEPGQLGFFADNIKFASSERACEGAKQPRFYALSPQAEFKEPLEFLKRYTLLLTPSDASERMGRRA
jgi:hypothetical protein